MYKQNQLRHRLDLQTFAGNPAGRLVEIEQRKSEIRGLLEGDSDIDLDKLEKELRDLDAEKLGIEKRRTIAAGIQSGEVEARKGETAVLQPSIDPTKEERKKRETRGKALKEERSVTVTSSNLVVPKHSASDLKPTFNEVSSLIDRVTHKPLPGGESFRQGYIAGYGEGGETSEGSDYTDAEPTFGYADIIKSKVTSYAEESEETMKLPDADYDGVIVDGITVAVRKRITRQILIGPGTTNRIAGIFSTAATAIDSATDLAITGIDETTLDEIIYSFGGDEDVEDIAVLVLHKKDLKAFSTLRDANGKRIYTVVNKGNTGTIDGVPFIINSACKAISDPANATGTFAMAYGPLSNYTLAIFSDIDVQRSTDYKFKQGMIAHKGSIFAGGNVTAKNGFLRVKKG